VLLLSVLDLPFAISPVVTGLMLVLLYGRNGWFAPVLDAVGFNVVFAFPGALTCPVSATESSFSEASRFIGPFPMQPKLRTAGRLVNEGIKALEL